MCNNSVLGRHTKFQIPIILSIILLLKTFSIGMEDCENEVSILKLYIYRAFILICIIFITRLVIVMDS